MVVSLTTTGSVALRGSSVSPPMVTLAAPVELVDAPLVFAKPVPVMVTVVPVCPENGLIPPTAIVGCAAVVNVKTFVMVALRPPGLVTVTSTRPKMPAGVTTVTVPPSAETTVDVRAALFLPKSTRAPCTKPVPWSVTVVPPRLLPETGLRLASVGAPAGPV